MNEIFKVAWLCTNNKRLLVARSKDKGAFYIPGGKKESGESDQEALLREINEELSIALTPATIRYAANFQSEAHEKPEGIQVNIACYFADYTGVIKAAAEIEEVAWLRHDEKDKCSPVTRLIMDWAKSEGLIE